MPLQPSNHGTTILPVEKAPLKDQAWLAGIIEGEGSFRAGLERKELIKDTKLPPPEREYRYNYLYPRFSIGLGLKSKASVERAGKLLGYKPFETKEKAVIDVTGEPAISIAIWALKFMTPKSEKYVDAKHLLQMFREQVGIVILPEDVPKVLGMTKEEHYRYVMKLKRKHPT